jgi:hypothetical protein
MAITQNTSGTKTVTVDVEHSLATITTAGLFQFAIDLSNMENGDIIDITIKTKLLTGSTAAIAYIATFAHVQGQPNQHSLPIMSPFSVEFLIEQTDGTARDYDWAVYEG